MLIILDGSLEECIDTNFNILMIYVFDSCFPDTEEYIMMLSRKHSLDLPRRLEDKIEVRAQELINGMEDITVTKLVSCENELFLSLNGSCRLSHQKVPSVIMLKGFCVQSP